MTVTELGLKPKSTDFQAFSPFTVPYSKGIRKPFHYPDSPIGRKGRRMEKKEKKYYLHTELGLVQNL